ncbi:MAG: 50S ribosomal protein L20 [Dehalococcoidia bacterium]|nr:50S ribosomal protein L20 [Dehalococcoidia bacterium]
MARVKRGTTKHRRHRAVLKAVRGHRGSRSRRYKVARESLLHAMAYQTAHRRLRKREMRALWILRINAAARTHGLSYSRLVHGLNLASVEIDRKQLADLSIREPEAFAEIARVATEALAA